ncbi:MAG TPA: hypothetical protein VFY54_15215 [Rubrobacter sp.]|nr:hypothetical protein [Rubrobacter sp.]
MTTTTHYGSVVLTFKAHREGDVYVSECVELGTSSFDETFEGAIEAAVEATMIYLESLIEEGQLEAVLQQHDVKLLASGQADDQEIPVTAHAGEMVSPRILKIPTLAA